MEVDGISLNLDILETGLINIILLIGILIYSGKDFLTELLEERKTTIITTIENAEQRLNEATYRLNEAQKQLNQSEIVIEEIKNEKIETKRVLLLTEADQFKKDLELQISRAFATRKTKQRQIFLEIKQKIIILLLNATVRRLQELFESDKKSSKLINKIINNLEGDVF